MLRIKADKWQEFCERAAELGFRENKGSYYYSDTNSILCRTHIDVENYSHAINLNHGDNAAACKLYDLITQGFVEKVEG